jgi:hypothetical protein
MCAYGWLRQIEFMSSPGKTLMFKNFAKGLQSSKVHKGWFLMGINTSGKFLINKIGKQVRVKKSFINQVYFINNLHL